MTDIIGKSQEQIQFEEQNLDLELMILTLLLSLTRREAGFLVSEKDLRTGYGRGPR